MSEYFIANFKHKNTVYLKLNTPIYRIFKTLAGPDSQNPRTATNHNISRGIPLLFRNYYKVSQEEEQTESSHRLSGGLFISGKTKRTFTVNVNGK